MFEEHRTISSTGTIIYMKTSTATHMSSAYPTKAFTDYMSNALKVDAVATLCSLLVWLFCLMVKSRPTATVSQISRINTWFVLFAVNACGGAFMSLPLMENQRAPGTLATKVFKYVLPFATVCANIIVLSVREVELKKKIKKGP
jgi:hypothetical protein